MQYSIRQIKAILKTVKKPHFAPEQPNGTVCQCKTPILVKGVVGIRASTQFWCIHCGIAPRFRVLDKLAPTALSHDQLQTVFGDKVPRIFVNRAKGLPDDYDGEEQGMSNKGAKNKMVLQMAEAKEGEGGYDFLTPANAKKFGGGIVVSEPRIVDTKFGAKLFVDLEVKKGKVFTWSANNKSRNYLIDKLGNNEKRWLKKRIDLVVVNQMVEGKLKDVIYAKGAVK